MSGTIGTGCIETYRGAVYPWHCDHMGHMNVMWYVGKFDEATWNLFAGIGITPAFLKEKHRAMAAVQQNITYKRELLSGDVVAVRSGIGACVSREAATMTPPSAWMMSARSRSSRKSLSAAALDSVWPLVENTTVGERSGCARCARQSATMYSTRPPEPSTAAGTPPMTI